MNTQQEPILEKELTEIFRKMGEPFGETLPHNEYIREILALLFLKYISDIGRDSYLDSLPPYNSVNMLMPKALESNIVIIPEGCSFYDIYEKRDATDLGKLINIILNKIEMANGKKLEGVFYGLNFDLDNDYPRDYERNKQLKMIITQLMAEQLDFRPSRQKSYKSAAVIFSTILEHFNQTYSARGIDDTPNSLKTLMVDLLQPASGMSLYDPTVGTGGLLTVANQWIKEREGEEASLLLFGQDRSLSMVSIAMMNMFFHQVYDASISSGNTLTHPQFVADGEVQKFDLVLNNAPFSALLHSYELEQLKSDPLKRFVFGIPRHSADFAFIQHTISSLNDTGRAVILVSNNVLFARGSEGEIKKKIVESDLIEAVIALGPGLFSATRIRSNLIVINKSKPQNKKGKILFINASSEYERLERQHNSINQTQREKITNAFNQYKSIQSFSEIVSLSHIRDNDYTLLPIRYMELLDSNNFLGGKVNSIALSSIADIFHGTLFDRLSNGEEKAPVISISDISSPRLKIDDLRKVSIPNDQRNIQYAQTGDILIPQTANPFRLFLVEQELNGVMVDKNINIIRLQQQYQNLQHYIIEFFRSDKGNSLLMKYGVGVERLHIKLDDLKRLMIPVPEDSVIQLITNLHGIESNFLQRLEKARELRTQLFNISTPELFQIELDELSTNAEILSSSLVQSDSLDYRIRNFYPFPLAFTYRTVSSLYDPIQKYPEQLRVAENILVFLAITGLTLANYCGVLDSDNNNSITGATIRENLSKGMSPGHWQVLASYSGKLLRGQREYALAESFSSLWFKGSGSKESDFGTEVKKLIQLKNDYKHDRGPKTPPEYTKASENIQQIIDSCYSELSFYIRHPIRLVQDFDIPWDTNEPVMDTLVYSGDHPGLRQERVSYPDHLRKNILYIELQKNKWLPLYPHMSIQHCSSCNTRETYFVDVCSGNDRKNKILLKSFERGHIQVDDEDANFVASRLDKWISDHLKGS